MIGQTRQYESRLSVRIAIVSSAALLYSVISVPLIQQFGPPMTAWVGLVVLTSAWFWGPWGGVLAGVGALPLNIILLNISGYEGFSELQPGLIGYVLLATGGGMVGWFSQLVKQVERQREALEKEQESLKREIDVRKRFETALRQRESIFRDLFDASPDAIFVESMEGTILDVNPAACELQNMEREELIGRNVMELAPEDKRDTIRTDFSRLSRGKNVYIHSLLYPQDGDPIPVEIKVSRIDYNDEHALLMHVRDVTERVRFANELERQLRESLLLNRVIQTATSTLDVDKVINTMCQELALSMDLPMAAVASLNDKRTQLTVIGEYVAEGYPSGLGATFNVADNPSAEHILTTQTPFISNDVKNDPRLESSMDVLGQRGTVSMIIVPIMVRDRVLGTFGLDSVEPRTFTQDEIDLAQSVAAAVGQAVENIRLYETLQSELAERQRTTMELKQAKEAAEAANRAKSVFLAQMSHELRTPLNSIIGYTDLLKSGMYGTLSDKQNDRLEKVHRNGRHLLTIINDILDISKIEAGRMEFEIMPTDLQSIVTECMANIKPMATKKGLTIESKVEEDIPALHADRSRVVQILMNLMNNAVKFTEEGEVRLEASRIERHELEQLDQPELEGEGPLALIKVIDTGIGIDAVNQSLIFDEFKQVDSSVSREYEGTGLGLAISYRLADLMGGGIWVDSTLGEGSTFSVVLPTTQAAPQDHDVAIVRPPTSEDTSLQ